MKVDVNGIILILSCQKHMNTRLKEFKLKEKSYNNWKVIYVIADFFLETDYKLDNENSILWIKCEDSYIHLLKKLVLSIKYLYELYNIKEGILRCGDDLIFNEDNLIKFLDGEKYDFYGQAYCGKDYICVNRNILKNTRIDYFMHTYYKKHPEDFNNPQHNIQNINILKYIKRPAVWGPAGVIYYLSNKAANILVNHLSEIDYNIFHFDDFTKSYPYTIEDCGVTYIMYYHYIKFTNNNNFFDNSNAIAYHTNKYK